MTDKVRLWMRSEARAAERRAPITPADARALISSGLAVTVEESPHRAFAIGEYQAAGCQIAPAGSWPEADPGDYIIGLKELPESCGPLANRHIYFGHAYKGQLGATRLLHRFAAGGAELLDLESLADADGRRLASFGFWAGYAGAAIAVLQLRGQLAVPLQPTSRRALDQALCQDRPADPPRVLVIGAGGRSGGGACSALATAGIRPTCWDRAETWDLDSAALLRHDLLVNAVLRTEPGPPFVGGADLDNPARQLRLIADITCDVTSDCNALPIIDATTSWQQPVRRLRDAPALDIIAIDNLPSLLPREASADFSAQLAPHLMTLGSADPAWQRCRRAFRDACQALDVQGRSRPAGAQRRC